MAYGSKRGKHLRASHFLLAEKCPAFFFSLSRNVAMYAIYFKVTFSTQLETSYEKFLNYATKPNLLYLPVFKRKLPFKKKFLCLRLRLFVSLELMCFRSCVNP